MSLNDPNRPHEHFNLSRGYPESLLAQVTALIKQNRLGEVLKSAIRRVTISTTIKALYQYTQDLKSRYLRGAAPINKVMYDNKIHVLNNALGLHTAISRVQGGKLKAKAEIRVATVFRDAPEDFLRMIVVHELAHLKEKEHNKAFYQLCCHMEPQYHQLEFDTRLWLTQLSLERSAP